MTSATEQPSTVAAVVVHDGRLLTVCRRLPEDALAWQLPAGTIRVHETAPEAAARETVAQTGVTVEPLAVMGQHTDPASGARTVYVHCRVVHGHAFVVDTERHAHVAWADRTLSRHVPDCVRDPLQGYLDLALLAS